MKFDLNCTGNGSPLPFTLTGGVFEFEIVFALRLTEPAMTDEKSAHVATKAEEAFMMILKSELVVKG